MAASGYSPISLYYSTTASATPTNTNLVNGELALNITDGKLFYKDNAGTVQTLATKAATSGSFSTTTISTSETLSYGTANGVAYLNGSKVVTTGSELAFDGNALTLGGSAPLLKSNMSGSQTTRFGIQNSTTNGNTRFYLYPNGTGNISAINMWNNSDPTATNYSSLDIGIIGTSDIRFSSSASGTGANLPFTWYFASEAMRLTSTGLGIGTSSPATKLDVVGAIRAVTASTAANNLRVGNTGNSLFLGVDSSTGGSNIVGSVAYATTLATNTALQISTNNGASVQATLDTSGNLGIGTSSPAVKLDVSGVIRSSSSLMLGTATDGSTGQFANSGGNGYLDYPGSLFFRSAASSTRLTLDSSGNLGLGVTPSAWISSGKAIDIAGFGSVAQTSSGSLASTFNAYQNSAGNWIYKTTNAAAQYQCGLAGLGQHAWYTAASGTAGNAITFTQAMTLNASGNLLVGTTSQTYLGSTTFKGLFVNGSANASIGVAGGSYTVANYGQLYLSGGYGDGGTRTSGFFIRSQASGGGGNVINDLTFVSQQTNGGTEVEYMRLDNSGNLGIGTSSPLSILTLLQSADGYDKGISITRAGANRGTIFLNASNDTLNFGRSTSTLMTLDLSGNLGLGVTPSAWTVGQRVLQFKDYGALQDNAGGGGGWGLSGNAYEYTSGAYKYLNNYYATLYRSYAGQHQWFIAPSGTAGNAITFTQAMTLDASGRLVIGGTTAISDAGITIANDSSGGATVKLSFSTTTTERGSISMGGGSGELKLTSGYSGYGGFTTFYTNGSERARITSGGEVYIAGTTDQGAYNLQVNGTGVWGAGAYVNGSDARLKEEVQDLAPALDVIASLRPVTFRYKEDYSKDQNVQPGFIAQELQTAMAGQAYVDGVIQSGPQHLNVAYQSLIPLLTKAIQELKAEFDAYKATHP